MTVCPAIGFGAMSMLYDLSRLRSGIDRLTRRFESSEFPVEEEFRLAAPVDLEVEIHKDATKVRVTGRVVTTLRLDCSRCLEPFDIPVNSAFDALVLPEAANAGEGEQQVADEDLGVSFYKDETLDLSELIREQFYLVLPMKPLCQADCRGLCSQCGTNLNADACDCAPVWEDPRLAALRDLGKSRES